MSFYLSKYEFPQNNNRYVSGPDNAYERARLILVGRVKQIRHGEGYPRFARVGSFGDHFLLENAMDFVGVACDPCKNQCKMGNPL